MSISRLNSDEKATYLLGLAVRRQSKASLDPEQRQAIATVLAWARHWLTDDEVHHLRVEIGEVMDDELTAELVEQMPPATDKPDTIPF